MPSISPPDSLLKSELYVCMIKQNNSGILRFYSKFFGGFELQRYLKLNISKYLRRMLTKLRISANGDMYTSLIIIIISHY
jgi:hypothetical protein